MNVKDNKYLRQAAGRRYLAVEGSNTGHCCFSASVIDLAEPHMVNGSRTRVNFYATVCECFDEEAAHKIAALLNGTGATE